MKKGGAQDLTTTFDYNTFGEVVASTDPLGRTTTYAYHRLGRNDQTVIAPEHHFRYDAFGNAIGFTSPAAADFLFGFTGRLFDADTSLQWNLNRWYDPAVGRWLSEDPIGYAAGDQNLYRYVGNQATGAIDPDGLEIIFPARGNQSVEPFADLPPGPYGPPAPPAAASNFGVPLYGGFPTLTEIIQRDPFLNNSRIAPSAVAWEDWPFRDKPLQFREEALVLPAPVRPWKDPVLGELWWRMDGTLVQEGIVFEWNGGNPVPIGYLENGRLVRGQMTLIPGEPDYMSGLWLLGSMFCEPIDWFDTGRAIWNDPTDPWNYACALPLLSKRGMDLFRKGGEALEEIGEGSRRLDDLPKTRANRSDDLLRSPGAKSGALTHARPRPFAALLQDIQANPHRWEAISAHTEKATRKGARRHGVSIQTVYRRMDTGETVVRHQVIDDSGRVVEDHFRPHYTPRAGD